MTTVSGPQTQKRFHLPTKPSILLVENDNDIRELILEMLAGAEFEVMSAPDGLEAVILAKREGQHVDLLLTEADPGGMRVQELARLLYQEHPGMKMLFMSGKFDEGFDSMLGEQAERLFLLKPFTRAILLQKIRDILR